MAWTNIFDVGACVVEVYETNGPLIPPEEYASRGIASIEVVDGVVTVTSDGITEIRGLDYRVTPEFDTQSAPVRVRDVQMVFGDAGYTFLQGAGTWTEGIGNTETDVDLTGEGFPTRTHTPSPAVVTPGGPWDAAGLVGDGGG